MSAAPDMKPSEALRKARELITPEEAWTKGFFARDVEGQEVWFTNKRAFCYCARGAIYHICNQIGRDLEVPAQDLFRNANAIRGDIARWNDAYARTHAEVLDAFDRAAALAEAEGR